MAHFQSLDDVMASYADRFYPKKASGVEGVIQFEFTRQAGGAYHLIIRYQMLQIENGRRDDPTVVVMTPGDASLAVNNGETSPLNLLMKGKLKSKGSLATAGKFQSMFKPGTAL